MESKKVNKTLFWAILIAVLFGSMLGAQVAGISLNKICLIPLYLYLLVSIRKLKVNLNSLPLLLFYCVAAASSIYAISADYASNYEGYTKECLLNAIQIVVIYIPLVIMLINYKEKENVKDYFIKSLKITARIHIVWAIAQFLLYMLAKIDINSIFLSKLYGESSGSALINMGGLGIFIRPTGLAQDPAFFGLILVLGFLFEKKTITKVLYFAMACIAMSRSTIVVMVLIIGVNLIRNAYKLRISKKKMIIFVGIVVAGVVAVVALGLGEQINALFSRFTNVKTASTMDGTSRHLYYIPASIKILFTKYNVFQFLIGFGPRQSGTIIANSHVMDEYLMEGMFTSTWAAETDFAELLLGYGFIGTVLYFVVLCRMPKGNIRIQMVSFAFIMFGLMYNITGSTLFNLAVIVFVTCLNKKKVDKENGEQDECFCCNDQL